MTRYAKTMREALQEVSRAESNKVNAQLSKILGKIRFTHIYNQKGGIFKLPPNVKHEVTVDRNDMKDAAALLMKDKGDVGFMFKQGQIRLVPAMRVSKKEEADYPHKMYDPKTGKSVVAKTPDDHDKYSKMGYTHTPTKIDEDGHSDVASAMRQCKTITEDATQIDGKLQTMSPEDSLPTWWTNKLAVSSNSMNKLRDYFLVPVTEETLDEKMKYTHAVVDNNGNVIGFTTNEKDAVFMSKNNLTKKKGTVVKLTKPMSQKQGDMKVGRKLFEEEILDEALKGFRVDFGKGMTKGSATYKNKKDAEEFAARRKKLGELPVKITQVTVKNANMFDDPMGPKRKRIPKEEVELDEQKVGGYKVDNAVVIRKGNKYHKTVDNIFDKKSDAEAFAKKHDGFIIPQSRGRFLVGLNKFTEETELDEMSYKPGSFKDTRPQEKGAKAFDKLIQSGGVDKKTFQKAKQLYVQASDPKSRMKLRDFIYNMDTEPLEAVMDLIGRNDPETFVRMYPDADEGERLSTISFRHKQKRIKTEELDDEDIPKVKKIIGKLKKASDAHAGQAKDLQKAIDEKGKEMSEKLTDGNLSLKDTVLKMWKEAKSPAQQAAIAIAKKEKEKKEEPDEGNLFGKKLKDARDKGEKTFTIAGKTYDVEKEEKKLDPVNPKAVKKKFDDRKDKDIDNDGDVDDTDKFLHKRRKAISKAINKEDVEHQRQRYLETKRGSLRDAILQMWGEDAHSKKDDEEKKKTLTKEQEHGKKKMTDTGKEMTPVDMKPKMPKIKNEKNKV